VDNSLSNSLTFFETSLKLPTSCKWPFKTFTCAIKSSTFVLKFLVSIVIFAVTAPAV
jgi:hypothetical protein